MCSNFTENFTTWTASFVSPVVSEQFRGTRLEWARANEVMIRLIRMAETLEVKPEFKLIFTLAAEEGIECPIDGPALEAIFEVFMNGGVAIPRVIELHSVAQNFLAQLEPEFAAILQAKELEEEPGIFKPKLEGRKAARKSL